MSKPSPEDLTILLWSETWSNEEHRFINQLWIVVHNEKVLCQGIPKYPYVKYHPILWDRYQKCQEWIDQGCIGDLQEGFTNLNVSFTEKFLVRNY